MPSSQAAPTRVLVLGYGNPGRQDDGLGPAAATRIGAQRWPHVTAHDNYQLAIEDAMDVAAHDVVWFVDAAREGSAPYEIRDVNSDPTIEFTTHIMRPEAVLAIARRYYGKSPQAFLLAIRGYEFEFVEELTMEALNNLDAALAVLAQRIGLLCVAAKV